MRSDFVLYAPSVHTGGGFVLLSALLAVWPPGKQLRAFLDARTKGRVELPSTAEVTWVAPRVVARLKAEFLAWRAVKDFGTIFCFHGLPPLLPLSGQVVVLLQNRLLIEVGQFAKYPPRVQIRLRIERLWSRMLRGRCSRYIVQTPSMEKLARQTLGETTKILVLPFAPTKVTQNRLVAAIDQKYDFVYIASGDAHKNHGNLIQAWRLLAEAGITPSLALTLDINSFPKLCRQIDEFRVNYGLDIANFGQLNSSDIAYLYKSSSALIFPSTCESFGLPLIEASQYGLPVLAPELDYVRDVVEPVETFDPASPLSIARAVRRFLGSREPVLKVLSAEEFLSELLR
jgi:glycosyltransferase involved in cell wall biosynthesis